MRKVLFTKKLTEKMAQLSNILIDEKEIPYFTNQFNKTIQEINLLKKLDTKKVKGTYHVIGVFNVFREDKIETERILSQSEALSNAPQTYKGFFVSKKVFDDR